MNFLYPIPITSIVTQTFAEHVHRAKVNNWQNYNGGIDWAVPTGSAVVASQAGTVTAVRHDATGYGSHIRIQHAEGYVTIYGHLMDFAVRANDKVRAGEVIGRSDNTGNSTGPHLHFELRKNGVPVDPAPLLVTFIQPEGEEPRPEEPGGGGTPGGGELPPEEPVGEEPESFPSLPLARVTSTVGLNIRMGPGIVNPVVGWLPTGKQMEVLRKVTDGGDTWLQIGHEQYVALQVGGETLAVWSPPAPQPMGFGRQRRSRKKKTT